MKQQIQSCQFDGRNYGIDIMKILSAFMVVFYHFGHRKYEFFEACNYVPNINYILQTLVAFSIPLFFMVNGALLLNKTYDNLLILKKIGKLLLIIVVWKVVCFPSWFLKTLVILYVLYPLLKKIFDNFPKILVMVILCFIIFPDLYNMIISILRFCSVESINIFGGGYKVESFPRTGFFTLYAIPLFLIGGICVKKKWKIKSWQSIILIAIGLIECLFEAVVITRTTGELFDSGNGNFPTIGAFLMAVGFFLLLYQVKIKESWKLPILFLGKNVLSVYLFHSILIHVINRFILPGIDTLPLFLNLRDYEEKSVNMIFYDKNGR